MTIPPPRDTDEIPPTDPAPPPTPTKRVPSMTEEDFARHEAVTAVRCPHPHLCPQETPDAR